MTEGGFGAEAQGPGGGQTTTAGKALGSGRVGAWWWSQNARGQQWCLWLWTPDRTLRGSLPSSSLSRTLILCLHRHPGVLPPPAEGHRGVRGAEDRVLPEPAGGGQCRPLLPAHRAEPGECPALPCPTSMGEGRGPSLEAWFTGVI